MITPKNWATFQHYKNRSPAWIKLHRGLLDDFAYTRLPVASKALAPLLWLLASEYEGGSIPSTTEEIAFRLRMPEPDVVDALKPLIESGFFFQDSKPLAVRKRRACLEKEGEREEEKDICPVASATRTKQKYSDEFETNFWKPFPRTPIMSKKEAWREWMKLDPEQRLSACRAIDPYRRHLKQTPTLQAVHACRFLSQNRAEGILEIASETPRFDPRSSML